MPLFQKHIYAKFYCFYLTAIAIEDLQIFTRIVKSVLKEAAVHSKMMVYKPNEQLTKTSHLTLVLNVA